ncbi:response regulator [Roseateles sp. DAIF2]|uniref:response regulator n=1 Tax=Roseateles sp. DAIF2 TaxID=2714952 RepID=UPI0018A294AC|nr:response regulator [Roseateles sp. DAIF2]QPF74061.1 response regulator [Roseateles sp. DAIF2]
MDINALVIEDERADRVVVRQTLASTAAGSSHVEYVESLAAGLERLSRGGIDVVLFDLSLPDSDGRATLQALRVGVPQIPLLMIAGATHETGEHHVQQFILRDRIDCHRLAHVLRSLIRHGP